MNLLVIGGFLFGNAASIRKVANNRSALWTGIALVLLAGVARNYDQNYFLETPLWLIGPLAFSFFSGSFLFWVLIRRIAGRHLQEKSSVESRWKPFMALFWMTAPIAWLYAIPVERFLDSFPAAKANIALLGIVALWRVLLMSRIISVLCEVPFLRTLGWVLFAASLEVLIVLFFGAFFSGSFSRSLLAGMAGMRSSPEQALLDSVLGKVWVGALGLIAVCLVILNARPFRGVVSPLAKPSSGRISWLSLLALVVIWTLIAIPAQLEQQKFVTHAAMVDAKNYSGALAYVARYQKRDFPPARRLEPNPYEYRVWYDLPPTISLLNSNTPAWIRQLYLAHLGTTFSHHYPHYESLTIMAEMLSAIEQLPEGRQWLLNQQMAMATQGMGLRYRSIATNDSAELMARSNILSTLRRMGMGETNLAQLEE